MKKGGPIKQRTPQELAAKKERRAAVVGIPATGPAKKKPIKKKCAHQLRTEWLDRRDREALREKQLWCERCQMSTTYELHHVRTKGAHPEPEFRHNPQNHCALCVNCHEWAHKNIAKFRAWFRKHRPEDAEAIKLPKENV